MEHPLQHFLECLDGQHSFEWHYLDDKHFLDFLLNAYCAFADLVFYLVPWTY